MYRDDEFTDSLPSDGLERLPYARRVGELIRTPGALERWRQECHESYGQSQRRMSLHEAWQKGRQAHLSKAWRRPASRRKPPADGWEFVEGRTTSPNGRKTKIVAAWVPSEFGVGREPYVGGPLPFSSSHNLSLGDCYFVLALIHDSERRDAGRINPFPFDFGDKPIDSVEEAKEWGFWYVMTSHLSKLRVNDQVTLDECLARVDAGLSPKRKKKSPDKKQPDSHENCIAVLTKHHRYADNSCLNQTSIGIREMKKKYGVPTGTASRFFKKEFVSHARYKNVYCRDLRLLTAALKKLNDEYPVDALFGETPPQAGKAKMN